MTDDVVVWNQLTALLPEAEAQEVRDCWSIGEQEAGLGLLVSGILAHQVPISETVRAQISVLAEIWGEGETLTPRILQCCGDNLPAHLKVLEHGGGIEKPAGGFGQDPVGVVLVPWIACTRCSQVLMRAHNRERWGGLSYVAHHYVITSPDGAHGPSGLPSRVRQHHLRRHPERVH
ncbi:hypothetical protein F4556_007148 [Kitasatospora gansuensis]|uniref:Uncharacterized protein n=1 Tax=Kitasatospora gansuensis TaxID=258050 RepID=A0A7W7WLV4_9ACTN|nr:hypothetical protein [Kitasatospora gansuensis]MBB4951613.1 hypothetical protein [Kitasatospora gansuensis]